VNRDVKIGIVISIVVFLVLVLIWSTRGPKEPVPSSLEEEEIVVAKGLEEEWLQRFEQEREAIVEIERPPVLVEKEKVEEVKKETPEEIDITPFTPPEKPKPEKEEVAPAKKRTHIVQKGDSLWKLADKYYGDGSKWRLIQEANKAIAPRTTALKIGLEIIIPELEAAPEVSAEGPSPVSAGKRIYVIKRGDLLWNLAVKFYGDGTKWKIIYEANKNIIPNPTRIPVGKTIVIPEMASGEATGTST